MDRVCQAPLDPAAADLLGRLHELFADGRGGDEGDAGEDGEAGEDAGEDGDEDGDDWNDLR